MLSAKWWSFCLDLNVLTHWGRVTHICVSKLAIIGSDNGLSPDRRQAIIWTNDGILLIGTLGTNFSEILIENRIFSFKKMGLKVSSAKWHPFCLGLNVLMSAIVPQLLSGRVSEWVIKFNSLSGDIGQWGPYSPYKPCNHSLYIGNIIFPHIDIKQSQWKPIQFNLPLYLLLNFVIHSLIMGFSVVFKLQGQEISQITGV